MKKLIVLVMILALTCGLLSSCIGGAEPTAEALVSNAEEALAEAPYTLTMKMNFACDNEEVNEILSAMNMEIPVTVDGKNLAMDIEMSMMGESVSATATVVDMVMYYDINVAGQSIKMKATMNEEQYNEFMAEQGVMNMMVKPEDFGSLTVEKKDGKNHIACGAITAEGLEKINGVVAGSLGEDGATAEFDNIAYEIVLNDGKYESMVLDCDYSVTVGGVTCNIDFSISAEYTYEGVAKVVAPADAASYTEMDFDEIMG